jgi:hypothetical protein
MMAETDSRLFALTLQAAANPFAARHHRSSSDSSDVHGNVRFFKFVSLSLQFRFWPAADAAPTRLLSKVQERNGRTAMVRQ